MENKQKTHQRGCRRDKELLVGLAVVSLFLHLLFLGYPREIVFDEYHFGKFAGYYLKNEFYFDVHPPLGKMLYAFVAYMAGYKGVFDFSENSKQYTSMFPYVAMRAYSAFLGTLLTPIVFLILRNMHVSADAAVFGAAMVAFDNALVVQTRFILLDSPLLFFMFSTLLCYTAFLNRKMFSAGWFLALFLTGTMLGCSISIKLGGQMLFSLMAAGTGIELWRLSAVENRHSNKTVLCNALLRLVFLVVYPLVLYVLFYAVHLSVLSKTGPGDTGMSPEFQATLANNHLNKGSQRVCYGTEITLKNRAEDVYLHSEDRSYPKSHEDGKISSGGQIVVGTRQSSEDSVWIVRPKEGDNILVVQAGDIIRLQHKRTGRYLMTHDVASPLTRTNQEVTLQNSQAAGKKIPLTDVADEWTLWKIHMENTNELCVVATRMTLQHVKTGVVLIDYKKKLPVSWGQGHKEINCQRSKKDAPAQWVVETAKIPANVVMQTDLAYVKLSMLGKLLEIQRKSLGQNARLTGDSIISSRPGSWPLMQCAGIPFWARKTMTQVKDTQNTQNVDGKKEAEIRHRETKIVMEGNKVVWYIAAAGIALCLAMVLAEGYRWHRNEETRPGIEKTLGMAALALGGYLLHYVPFFFVGRVLYLHHYLPCVVFGMLAAAATLDNLLHSRRWYVRQTVFTTLVSSAMYSFLSRASLVYGL